MTPKTLYLIVHKNDMLDLCLTVDFKENCLISSEKSLWFALKLVSLLLWRYLGTYVTEVQDRTCQPWDLKNKGDFQKQSSVQWVLPQKTLI